MKKKKSYLFILLWFTLATANRGEIALNPDVKVFEPNQRAMIAWNGVEEILLLSTDLYSSESTMVIEVLPLPAEPEVKKGELETFRKAVKLINHKIAIHAKKNGGRNGGEAVAPSGEVTSHEKIGAHDISITHLLDTKGFIKWVADYLASLGIENEVITTDMKNLIEEYTADNYTWFVFDLITLKKELVTNEPIQYQFKSKRLFYPLKISKTITGETSIELVILTPKLLKNFPELPLSMVKLQHKPVDITSEELKDLNEDMHALLKDESETKLRIWKIEGDLESFSNDLVAY